MTNREALEILHEGTVYNPLYLDALNIAIESLENQERIVGKLIDAYAKAHIKSKTIGTPRETLIRWDGHKEGISEAIDIVKGGK